MSALPKAENMLRVRRNGYDKYSAQVCYKCPRIKAMRFWNST